MRERGEGRSLTTRSAMVDRYVRLRKRGVDLLVAAGLRASTLYFQLGGEGELGRRGLSLSQIRGRAKP